MGLILLYIYEVWNGFWTIFDSRRIQNQVQKDQGNPRDQIAGDTLGLVR